MGEIAVGTRIGIEKEGNEEKIKEEGLVEVSVRLEEK